MDFKLLPPRGNIALALLLVVLQIVRPSVLQVDDYKVHAFSLKLAFCCRKERIRHT